MGNYCFKSGVCGSGWKLAPFSSLMACTFLNPSPGRFIVHESRPSHSAFRDQSVVFLRVIVHLPSREVRHVKFEEVVDTAAVSLANRIWWNIVTTRLYASRDASNREFGILNPEVEHVGRVASSQEIAKPTSVCSCGESRFKGKIGRSSESTTAGPFTSASSVMRRIARVRHGAARSPSPSCPATVPCRDRHSQAAEKIGLFLRLRLVPRSYSESRNRETRSHGKCLPL